MALPQPAPMNRYDGAFEFCSRKFWWVCTTFNSGQLRNNFRLGENFSARALCIIISLIKHKNNTQTDGHHFSSELFQSCSMIQNNKRSTRVLQIFDTSPFLLFSIWFLRLFICMTYCFLFHFLHVVNYKSAKRVPVSADWLRRKNVKALRVKGPW